MADRKIRITLDVPDDDGSVVDATYQDLSEDAVVDVIHHAIELVEATRKGDTNAMEWAQGELESALAAYSLIDDPTE